jgi:branched-chain amino acid transport system ATP-binding protein
VKDGRAGLLTAPSVLLRQRMLEIRNLHKRFKGLHALEDVSLTLESGKIWSLIGPNGAGKTTLFNLISGTLTADVGKLSFMDHDITGLRSYQICRLGIARTYQQKNLFPNLCVYENVAAGTLKEKLDRRARRERIEEILDFLGLTGRKNEVVSSLPPLDSKFVELGRALATGPRLILLDELIGGLLPSETERICDVIRALKGRGLTIFQIGHEMGPIMETSDWIFVLDEGRKIAEGTPEQIGDNLAVHDVYLE